MSEKEGTLPPTLYPRCVTPGSWLGGLQASMAGVVVDWVGGVGGWEGESLGICLINPASLCIFLGFCQRLTQPQKGSLIAVMLRTRVLNGG